MGHGGGSREPGGRHRIRLGGRGVRDLPVRGHQRPGRGVPERRCCATSCVACCGTWTTTATGATKWRCVRRTKTWSSSLLAVPGRTGATSACNLTLKKEATKPASLNFLQSQERFDRFTTVYNQERPHQALGGAYPGDLYTPSARVYTPPPEPEYPFHDKVVRVTHCGRICIGRRKINLSRVFAGELVGLREVDDQVWLVSFLDFDLGFFDQDEGRVEPAPNPFEPEKVLTMSPE